MSDDKDLENEFDDIDPDNDPSGESMDDNIIEDDFDDEFTDDLDEDMPVDDWDDFDDNDLSEFDDLDNIDQPTQKAGKKSNINTIIIVIGGLAAAAVVIMNLTQSPSGTQNVPAPSPQVAQEIVQTQTETAALPQPTIPSFSDTQTQSDYSQTTQKEQNIPKQGMLNDASLLQKLAETMPKNNNSNGAKEQGNTEAPLKMEPMPNLRPNAQQNREASALTPLPQGFGDTLPDVYSDSPGHLEKTTTNKSAATIVTSAPSTEIETLNQRLDLLFARLDEIENNIPGNNMDSEIKQLQQTVKQLEQKISSTQIQPKQTSASTSPKTKTVKRLNPVQTKPEEISKPVARSPKTEPVNWIMRSAQPGTAYLSQPGSRELTQINTGETLPGIGTVTFIGTENNEWIVRGTKGIIRQ